MIRIVQCLCGPKRHCILAIAYEPGMSAAGADGNDVVLNEHTASIWFREMVEGMITPGGIYPWCGICYSVFTRWIYEDRPTKFTTLDEAQPELRRLEEENRLSRELIDSIKARAGTN